MACTIIQDPHLVHSKAKNGENIFINTPEMTYEDIADNLDHINENVVMYEQTFMGEVREAYEILGKKYKHRASDKAALSFKGRVSEVYQQRNKERSEIAKTLGTDSHNLMERIFPLVQNNKFDQLLELGQEVSTPNENGFFFSEAAFAQFVELAKGMWDEISKHQQYLNNINGTDLPPIIRLENAIIDPEMDVAGRIDVTVIFSDKTVWTYDYKTSIVTSENYFEQGSQYIPGSKKPMGWLKIAGYTPQQITYKRGINNVGGEVQKSILLPMGLVLRPESKQVDAIFHPFRSDLKDSQNPYEKILTDASQTLLSNVDNEIRRLQKLADEMLYKARYDTENAYQLKKRAENYRRMISALIDGYDLNAFMNNTVDVLTRAEDLLRSKDRLTVEKYEEKLGDIYKELKGAVALYEMSQDIINELRFYDEAMGTNRAIKAQEILNNGIFNPLQEIYNTVVVEKKNIAIARLDQRFVHKDNAGNQYVRTAPLMFGQRWLQSLQDIEHPYFYAISDLLRDIEYEGQKDFNEELARFDQAMKPYINSEATKGISYKKAMARLIDKKYGRLIKKFKEQLYEDEDEALQDKNAEWIKANREIRDVEKFKESLNRRRQNFIRSVAAMNGLVIIGEGEDISVEFAENFNLPDTVDTSQYLQQFYESLAAQLDRWEKEHNLLEHDSAWLIKSNLSYYTKLKDELSNNYYTDEYLALSPEGQNLLEYLYDLNVMARRTYGKYVPIDFIPEYTKTFVEGILESESALTGSGRMAAFMEKLSNEFRITPEDAITIVDPNGDQPLRMPHYGTIPLVDTGDKPLYSRGNEELQEKNAALKSFDLNSIIPMFIASLSMYKHFARNEAAAQAIMDIAIDPKVTHELAKNKGNKDMLNQMADKAFLKLGMNNDAYQALRQLWLFRWYGIRYEEGQQNGIWKNLSKGDREKGRGPVNSMKMVLTLKDWYSKKVLGLGVIPGVAAFVAGVMSGTINAASGRIYSTKTFRNAVRRLRKDYKQMAEVSKALQTRNLAFSTQESWKRAQKERKYSGDYFLYLPYHMGDNGLTDIATRATLENWGIAEDGRIMRLDKLPEGTPSIWSQIKFKEDGQADLDFLTKAQWIKLHNMGRLAAKEIFGQLGEHEKMGAQHTMIGNIATQFKTWMYEIYKVRLGTTRTNRILEDIQEGRYKTFYHEMIARGSGKMSRQQAEEMLKHNATTDGNTMLKNLMYFTAGTATALLEDLVTLGRFHKEYQMDENRQRVRFLSWKQDNAELATILGETEEQQFAAWKEMIVGNMKSGFVELQMLTAMILAMALLRSDFDDDDVPLYAEDTIWAYPIRQLYKVVGKTNSELILFLDPKQIQYTLSNPLPVVNMLRDLISTVENTGDEITDIFESQPDNRDKTGWFYYSSRWIPGVNQLRRVLEIWEQDKQNPWK